MDIVSFTHMEVILIVLFQSEQFLVLIVFNALVQGAKK